MSSIRITIPFTPKPKMSVRIGKWGAYNPSAQGMKKIKDFIKERLTGHELPFLQGPLLLVVHFLMPLRKSLLGAKRKKKHLTAHTQRPEGDNLEKCLNDACSGILWKDDSQIVWLVRSKSWIGHPEGAIVLFAKEISPLQPDYKNLLIYIK